MFDAIVDIQKADIRLSDPPIGFQRYVICGPPGAGKTTWVQHRARPGDLVWDMDAMAETLASSPQFPRPPHVLDALMVMRRSLTDWLSTQPQVSAFIIVTNEAEATHMARNISAELVTLGDTRGHTPSRGAFVASR